MGCKSNITIDKFPRQGDWLYKTVDVLFHYDSDNIIEGIIVRDDKEDPWVTIIKLADGKYVLSTECQHSQPK